LLYNDTLTRASRR